MNRWPEVSVVIATRNRHALLERLLVAVERAVAVDVAVVVVDEASSDPTPDRLRHAAERWGERLQVVHHPAPLGPAGARNAGLARVRTPWVAFVDDDDLIAPTLLAETIAAIEAHPGAGWSFTTSVHVDDELEIVSWRDVPVTHDFHRLLLSGNKIPATGQGLVVSTALARGIGGYDTDLFGPEDWDFALRLAAEAPPAPVRRPLNAYRLTGFGVSGDPSRMATGIEKVAAKHAATRRRLGVELDRSLVEGSLAAIELAAGNRWAAASRQVRAFAADHRPRTLARAGLGLLSPRWALAQGARRRAGDVPEDVASQARVWLDELAAACRARGVAWKGSEAPAIDGAAPRAVLGVPG